MKKMDVLSMVELTHLSMGSQVPNLGFLPLLPYKKIQNPCSLEVTMCSASLIQPEKPNMLKKHRLPNKHNER